MTKTDKQIEVNPASPDEQHILENLIQLYAHDFSEFHNVELDADGRFLYKPLPLYWLEPGRHPFLVRIGGKLAGFALVRRGSQVSGDATVWDMAEFFVIRGFRRRHIGTDVAVEVWRQFPGRWEIRVMESNQSAFCFWERATAAFTGEAVRPGRFEKNGEEWYVFSFESGADRLEPHATS
jgi:predicted acetyltransferase